jgi:hypothetical protein
VLHTPAPLLVKSKPVLSWLSARIAVALAIVLVRGW